MEQAQPTELADININPDLCSNKIRIISATHGIIEVTWHLLHSCLLKQFANPAPPSIPQETSQSQGTNPARNKQQPDCGGYRWRKYGHKRMVNRDSSRVYYRCADLTCPAKKRVEIEDLTGVATDILCGPHNHPPPQNEPPKSSRSSNSSAAPRKRRCLSAAESPGARSSLHSRNHSAVSGPWHRTYDPIQAVEDALSHRDSTASLSRALETGRGQTARRSPNSDERSCASHAERSWSEHEPIYGAANGLADLTRAAETWSRVQIKSDSGNTMPRPIPIRYTKRNFEESCC